MNDEQRERQLLAKLLRELSQAEHDAYLHTRREAKRLGPSAPSDALLAISRHADVMRGRLRAIAKEYRIGHALGVLVATTFSNIRHYGLDRLIAPERSYRGTLLGLRHGLDATHLLRFVSLRLRADDVTEFCDDLIAEREQSLARAVDALEWFADHPARAAG